MKIWSLQDRKLYWRDAQLLEKIENELLKVKCEMCYFEYDDFEELEHLMSLPTANQTAAQYPWTNQKIEIGIHLMRKIEQGQQLLNKAFQIYLDQKNNSNTQVKTIEAIEEKQALEENYGKPSDTHRVFEEQVHVLGAANPEVQVADGNDQIPGDDGDNQTDVSSGNDEELFLSFSPPCIEADIPKANQDDGNELDDDEDSWTDISDISSDDDFSIDFFPFRCTSVFRFLKQHLTNDEITIDHLKKLYPGCQDVVQRDLHNIITNYRVILEGYALIAKICLEMNEIFDQIIHILADIPEKLIQMVAQPIGDGDPAKELAEFLRLLLIQQ